MDPRIDDPHQRDRERMPEDDLIESVADEEVERTYRVDTGRLSGAKLRLLKLAIAWRREEDEVVAEVGDEAFRDAYGVDRSELPPGRARALTLALGGRPPSPPVRPPGVPLDAVHGSDGLWRLEELAYDETGREVEQPRQEP